MTRDKLGAAPLFQRRILTVAITSWVGLTLGACSADARLRGDEDAPVGEARAALNIEAGYSWQAADTYIEDASGPFLELCCTECSSEYLDELLRWELARNDFRRWQEARKAMAFALAKLASHAGLIALQASLDVATGPARDLMNKLDVVEHLIKKEQIPELSARAAKLKLTLGAAIGFMKTTVMAVLQQQPIAVDAWSQSTSLFEAVISEMEAFLVELAKGDPKLKAAANGLEHVLVLVHAIREGIAEIEAAVPELESLSVAADAAKAQLDLDIVQLNVVRSDLQACCASGCVCPSGTQLCGGQCAPDVCTDGKFFDSANCVCACPTGTVDCNGACVDSSCSGGRSFNYSTCVCECPTGTTWDPAALNCAASDATDFYISVDDYARLMIDGQLIASYDASPWGVAQGTANLSPGWHTIQLDYANRWGSTHFSFYRKKSNAPDYLLVPKSSMRSGGASGGQIEGLRADYSGGGQSFTVFGEGPINHGWPSLYQGSSSSLWAGAFDANWGVFSETLTGEILIQ